MANYLVLKNHFQFLAHTGVPIKIPQHPMVPGNDGELSIAEPEKVDGGTQDLTPVARPRMTIDPISVSKKTTAKERDLKIASVLSGWQVSVWARRKLRPEAT